MKKLNKIFGAALVALAAAFAFSACSSGNDEQLGNYNKCNDAATFKLAMTGDYVIIDSRSQADYEAGHIPGAVWFKEATAPNTKNNGSEWCQDLLTLFPANGTNTRILIYSNSSDKNMWLPGRVSKLGYGHSRTYNLMNGYKDWVKAGEATETDTHILPLP